MSLTRRALMLSMACSGLLAGCDSPPPPPLFPDIRFNDGPPIALKVSSISIRSHFQPQFHPPYVEHLFPESPQRAIDTWARDRLRAVGGDGIAIFTIVDAAVTETELPRTGGIKGEFTTQAAERYDAVAQARLEIMGPDGFAVRSASATVRRSQSVLEGISPNDRDQAWYDMTRALARDFDRQMTGEIRNNFGNYAE
jgi:hypothetical protein